MRIGFMVFMFVVYIICIWGDNTAQAAGLISGGQASILHTITNPSMVGDWNSPLSTVGALFVIAGTYLKATFDILSFNFSFFNMDIWSKMARLIFIGCSFGFIWSMISLLRGVHSS
jgi:hypothetical protein